MPEYTLKLSSQGVELLLAALGELKLRDSIDLYFDIRSQVMQQNEENQAQVAQPATSPVAVQEQAEYMSEVGNSVPRVKAEPVKPK